MHSSNHLQRLKSRRPRNISFLAFLVLRLSEAKYFLFTETKPKYDSIVRFDTGFDTQTIGIDNRASICITHDIIDFKGPLMNSRGRIHGFAETFKKTIKKSTAIW